MHRLATRAPGIVAALFGFVLLALRPAAGAAAPGWNVEVTPGGELFPILDLSQTPRADPGAIGDGSGLVGITIAGPTRAATRVRIELPYLDAPTVIDVPPIASGSVTLRPRFDWNVDALSALKRTRAASMRVTVTASGDHAETRAVAVRLHPLDDALYYVREEGAEVDLSGVFAAYVDPDDAVVDAVLALAGADDPAIDEDRARLEHVRAVWNALERHGMRYADGDPQLSHGPSIFSQRVRLLSQSWQSRRANCIDSSVLIASVLERLGIPVFIVLVPRHAFVGFYADDGRRSAHFLETTLLGATAGGPASFDAASEAGRRRFARVAGKFDAAHRPDYALIDLDAARRLGTRPIGERRTRAEHPAAAAARNTIAPRDPS